MESKRLYLENPLTIELNDYYTGKEYCTSFNRAGHRADLKDLCEAGSLLLVLHFHLRFKELLLSVMVALSGLSVFILRAK